MHRNRKNEDNHNSDEFSSIFDNLFHPDNYKYTNFASEIALLDAKRQAALKEKQTDPEDKVDERNEQDKSDQNQEMPQIEDKVDTHIPSALTRILDGNVNARPTLVRNVENVEEDGEKKLDEEQHEDDEKKVKKFNYLKNFLTCRKCDKLVVDFDLYEGYILQPRKTNKLQDTQSTMDDEDK